MPPLNTCCSCEEDFASLAAFEHILSAPSDPVFDCMSLSELESQGWTQDKFGRWTSPKLRASAERMREAFSKA
jgi:hypothetical protein